MKQTDKQGKAKKSIFFLCFLLFILSPSSASRPDRWKTPSETSILGLLDITPPPESFDYMQKRTQLYLDHLTTEQRHPQTLNLSQLIMEDIQSGLRQLLTVEEDIEKRLRELSSEPEALDRLVGAIETAVLKGNRVFIYGSGPSGRLAKQIESTFWRSFWKRVKTTGRLAEKPDFTGGVPIENRLIGQMTGGDRALLGSLEPLEDLMLMGWLQVQQWDVRRDDVVICLTESGEIPSVIGALQAALELWKKSPPYQPRQACQKLFFIYNNPDEQLLLFDRIREILEDPGITKINLTTGPQAVTGSTRLQASTINSLVLGHALQSALFRCLRRFLSKREMARIGFTKEFVLQEQLTEFSSILREIKRHLPLLADFSLLETGVAAKGSFTTFYSQKGFFTVLNDLSGRILEFHLPHLDSAESPNRESSIQIWNGGSSSQETWAEFLDRPFRGLTTASFLKPICTVVADPYMKQAVVESLKKTGSDQAALYDFSMTADNLIRSGPSSGDLGVCVLVSPEEPGTGRHTSNIARFMRLFSEEKRHLVILWITDRSEKDIEKTVRAFASSPEVEADILLPIRINSENDPLGVNEQIALKVVLNSHSSAVMAGLGRMTGNFLTCLNPVNFRLLGQATRILQSVVNDTLNSPQWVERYGIREPLSFGEANAVLFANRKYLQENIPPPQKTSEIECSAIQILESLRTKNGLTHKEALDITRAKGLSRYLMEILKKL